MKCVIRQNALTRYYLDKLILAEVVEKISTTQARGLFVISHSQVLNCVPILLRRIAFKHSPSSTRKRKASQGAIGFGLAAPVPKQGRDASDLDRGDDRAAKPGGTGTMGGTIGFFWHSPTGSQH